MPPTKAQVLADLQAKLDAAFINPDITDKRHLLGQMSEAQSISGALNPSGTGGTPGDIIAGIDGSADIDLIKGLLTDIKLELVNSKSIADILIQDYSQPTRYFVRQDSIDQTTGTAIVTILNLDGSVPSPAPVQPFQPVKASSSNQVTEDLYIVTITGTGYAIGDSLSNVRLLDGSTGTIAASLWYNLTSGLTIASPPPIANLKGYADKVEELLVAIVGKLPTLGLTTAVNSLPVSLPTDGVLPLPTGAATALLQGDTVTKLTSIDTKIATLATVAKQVDMLVALNAIATNSSAPNIRPLTAADVVTVVLPTTAATTAKQDIANIALAQLGLKLDAIGTTETAISTKLPASLGAKPAAESLSIAIASDSTFPLASNAATATLQEDVKFALGQLGDPAIALSESDATATIAALIRLLIQQSRLDGETELSAIGDYLSHNIAADPAEIANFKSLLRGFWKDSDPTTTRSLLNQIIQALTNGSSATQITNLPADPAKGALQIAGNTSLNAIASGINTIATNTGRISQYQFMPAETSAGVVFLLRTDGVTGQTVKIDLATGLAFVPGSIELTDPIVPSTTNTKVIEPNEFVAKTTVAGKWMIDDILTRVVIVDTSNNTITGTIWQDAAGNLLSQTPVMGVDVEDTNKTQLAILKAQPIAGLPITAEALPSGSGTYGWLSYLRSTLQAISAKLNIGSSSFSNSIGVNLSAKVSVGGFLVASGTSNNNYLDGTGTGAATDVRDFNSLQITIAQTSVVGNITYTIQSAIDAAFTVGVKIVEAADATGTITNTIIVNGVTTAAYRVNLANENYIRVIRGSTTGNCTVYGVLSQQPINSRVTASISPNQTIGSIGTIASDQLAITGATTTPDAFFTTLTNGTTTYQGAVGTWGVSNLFTVVVNTVAGTLPTLDITIQESNDNGSTWRTAYVFPTISATGTYASPLVPQIGRQYQYVRVVNGTSASFFCGIYKYPSNVVATSTDKVSSVDTISAVGGIGGLLALDGKGVATFGVSGGFLGTLQVQLSTDDLNWFSLNINNALYSLTAKTFVTNANINGAGIYQINVGAVKSARLIATAWGTGSAVISARASTASNVVAIEGQPTVNISNSSIQTNHATGQTFLDSNSTIVASQSTVIASQSVGSSRAIEVNVSAISAATTYTVEIQEPLGTGWKTVYKFAPITIAQTLRSAFMPNAVTNWRYVETVTGATPSVTRVLSRVQSNAQVNSAIGLQRTGGFNLLNTGFDLPLYGRTRRIVATNRTATLYFMQIHDSATALTTGAVPLAAEVYQLPASATVPFTVADLGEFGTVFGTNPRLALSTTFNTYTPLSVVAAGQISLFVESI
jgi:hypothetical protein